MAVIGAGASGTLVSASLLRLAASARLPLPLQIELIDRHGRHGLGQAYATSHPRHLLNSPVSRTSALTADPADLARWADTNGIRHDGFLPRGVFGRYLRDVLANAERAARGSASVNRVTGDVVSVTRAGPEQRLRLRLASGRYLDADVAVLASGNRPPAPPCEVPSSPCYVADPWAPGALDEITDGSPVAVLGTGLTMLDVAIAVTSAHRGSVVHAVSRHGLLPRAHRRPHGGGHNQAPELGLGGPAELPALIRAVKTAATEASDNWDAVVDALRPQIPWLWQELSLQHKRLFLRHVARYWEIHRHRMPPATARRIAGLRSAGRLSVLACRVVVVREESAGLRITIERESGLVSIRAGWLVNATGPAADIAASADPLLRQLFRTGLAVPDPLGLGLAADASGALLDSSGSASDSLFTLGPPLRGQLYETTAIPEIREQATVLADRIVVASLGRVMSGNAA